jgi:hypothetical protein
LGELSRAGSDDGRRLPLGQQALVALSANHRVVVVMGDFNGIAPIGKVP